MHDQNHPNATSSPSSGNFLKALSHFDILDWIAAFVVVATPVYMAFRLFWN